LGDNAYNALKKSTTVILPAVGALYFALAQLWHLPKPEEVIGTVAAVNTFLGVVLHASTSSYNKSDTKYAGVIQVEETPEKKVFSINLNGEPEDLEKRNEVTFKVNSDTGSTPVVQPPVQM
jgi:imidazoleglycerol phosphate synthase glutamine amidotransferase subunit HisH